MGDDSLKVDGDPPEREGVDDLNADRSKHQILNHEPNNPDELGKDDNLHELEVAVGKEVRIRFVEDEKEEEKEGGAKEGDGEGGGVEGKVDQEAPDKDGAKKNEGYHEQDASDFISQLSETGVRSV